MVKIRAPFLIQLRKSVIRQIHIRDAAREGRPAPQRILLHYEDLQRRRQGEYERYVVLPKVQFSQIGAGQESVFFDVFDYVV